MALLQSHLCLPTLICILFLFVFHVSIVWSPVHREVLTFSTIMASAFPVLVCQLHPLGVVFLTFFLPFATDLTSLARLDEGALSPALHIPACNLFHFFPHIGVGAARWWINGGQALLIDEPLLRSVACFVLPVPSQVHAPPPSDTRTIH